MLSEKVPYFILDLLQHTPVVGVEGLGRFEAIFHPAVIDGATSVIHPPALEAVFQEAGDTADQILPVYIRYVTGANPVQAEDAIKTFVQKVREALTQTSEYVIDKFGRFSNDTDGQIRFTPDWDAFNLVFRDLKPLDLSVPIVPAVETNVPVYTVPVYEPTSTEKVTEEVVPEPVAPYVPAETVTITPETNPIVYPTVSISSPDENTSRLWWIILTSAIVLITILCVYLAWDIISNHRKLDELKKYQPTLQPAVPVDTLTETDTAATDTGVSTSEVTPPDSISSSDHSSSSSSSSAISSPSSSSSSSPSDCFIVVGAFSDSKNVVNMEERLASLNYTSERITKGGLTRVAIRTSCDPTQMQQVLSDARNNINPEAWIY